MELTFSIAPVFRTTDDAIGDDSADSVIHRANFISDLPLLPNCLTCAESYASSS